MREDHRRLSILRVILASWFANRVPICVDIPRHLWGDIGVGGDRVPGVRRRAGRRFLSR